MDDELRGLVERLRMFADMLRYADEMSLKPEKPNQVETTQITTAESKMLRRCLQDAIEALAASSPPSRSAPDGRVLVPREPTEEMIEAAKLDRMSQPEGVPPGAAMARMWRAMLAAAPPTPSSTVDEAVVERAAAILSPHLRSTFSGTNPDVDDQARGRDFAMDLARQVLALSAPFSTLTRDALDEAARIDALAALGEFDALKGTPPTDVEVGK